MKQIISILVILLISSSVFSSEIVELSDEIRIPVPDNWLVSDDSTGFPYQIINAEETAELLIFKSFIDEDAVITNKKELRESVTYIVEDIIMTLPEGILQTNTGNFEENSLSFTLEFRSTDTVNNSFVYHRLKGILYNHPEGHQLLFTLWGKADSEAKSILREEILFSQDNFVYLGEAEEMVFVEQKPYDWRAYILLIFVFVAILFFFRKMRGNNKIKFSEDSHFWRCECGRQNHNSHTTCKRCGREQPIEIKI